MRFLIMPIVVLVASSSSICFGEPGHSMNCDFYSNNSAEPQSIQLSTKFSPYRGNRGAFLSLTEKGQLSLKKDLDRDLQILGVSTSNRTISKSNFHSYHSFQFPWFIEGEVKPDDIHLEISNWSGRSFWSRYYQVTNQNLDSFFDDLIKSKLGKSLRPKIDKELKLTRAGHWQLHQAVGQFRTFIKQFKVYMRFTNGDMTQETHVFARLISERFNAEDLKNKRAFQIVGPDAKDSKNYLYFLVCKSF